MKQERDIYPRRHPQLADAAPQVWNWAQNYPVGGREAVQRPDSEAQLQNIVAAGRGKIKVMGSRLSPGELLRIDGPEDILIDPSALCGLIGSTEDTVTFGAATPLHEVYRTLDGMGRMLPCSPGVIALQTLAGAIATGTHGQGLQQSSLADEMVCIRLVRGDGEIIVFTPDDPRFGAVQLALGALGVITEITLRTQPTRLYTCQKSACGAEHLHASLYEWNEGFPFSKAWWFPAEDQVHVWRARDATAHEQERYRLNKGQPVIRPTRDTTLNATVDRTLRHMENDTKIKNREGKPYQTVTRFKDFSDVTGNINQLFCRGIATPQINIEIGIPLRRAGEMINRIKEWHRDTNPHMHYPIILRCTGPSNAWLSPAYGEATCFFGFVVYYAEDGSLSADGMAFINEAEKLLAQAGGRPHWGKYYDKDRYRWPELYPRWQQFCQVKRSLDPKEKFTNTFINDIFR